MMHKINNNILATFAIILMLISISGQFMVNKKANEIDSPLKKITGKATATVSLIIMKPFTELNLRGKLANDNITVILEWDNLSQENVSIYMTNDLTTEFDYVNPNVTGIKTLNWSDPTANTVNQRFYRIGVLTTFGFFNYSLKIIGKYNIPIKFADGNPASYELNSISIPLIPENLSFDEIIREGTPGDIILRYNTTDTGTNFKGWETNLKLESGNWIKGFETFSIFEGYIFPFVQNPYNLTIIGEVPSGIVEIPMVITTGSPTNYERMLMGWNSIKTECDLARALNTTTPPGTYVWFDTTDLGANYAGWKTQILIFNGTDNVWFPTNGCMQPGVGYNFIQIGTAYNWSYNRTY